jgi:Thrombospondin type 3 repeat
MQPNVSSCLSLLSAILATSCGRVGFDPVANADSRPPLAITNDEDQDGIDNLTDNCPFVPNANQRNGDSASGDTVGDACDPETNELVKPHRITLFEPLNDPMAQGIVIPPEEFVKGTSEYLCDSSSYLEMPVNIDFERSEIWVGAEIIGTRPFQQGEAAGISIKLTAPDDPSSKQIAYLEIYDEGGGSEFKLTKQGGSSNILDTNNGLVLAELPSGPFDLRLQFERLNNGTDEKKIVGRLQSLSDNYVRCTHDCPTGVPVLTRQSNTLIEPGFYLPCWHYQTIYRYVAVVTRSEGD